MINLIEIMKPGGDSGLAVGLATDLVFVSNELERMRNGYQNLTSLHIYFDFRKILSS